MCFPISERKKRISENLKALIFFDWYAIVFWCTDYEYDENCRQSHWQGQILNYIFHIFVIFNIESDSHSILPLLRGEATSTSPPPVYTQKNMCVKLYDYAEWEKNPMGFSDLA